MFEVQYDDVFMDVVEFVFFGNDVFILVLDIVQVEEFVVLIFFILVIVDGVLEVQSCEFEIFGVGSELILEVLLGVEGVNEVDVDFLVFVEQDVFVGDDIFVVLEQVVFFSLDLFIFGLEFVKDGGDVVFLSKDEEVDVLFV